MKTQLTLLLLLACYIAKAQDNPYASFGHESEVKYETNISQLHTVYNTDTSSTYRKIAFDYERRYIYYLNDKDSILKTSSFEGSNIMIWLSTDPLAADYPDLSPYSFVANNPIIFIDPDGRKIVWGDDANSEAIKKQVLALVNSSEVFAAVYNYLDGLERTIDVRVDDAVVQQRVRKATGDPQAEARGFASTTTDEIFFSEKLANNKTFSEEFFHKYQMYYYEEAKEQSPNLDAEAKVFNVLVTLESLGRLNNTTESITPFEAVSNASENMSDPNVQKLVGYSGGNPFNIVSSLVEENKNNSLKIEGENAMFFWQMHLEDFKVNNNQTKNNPYGTGSTDRQPSAYNKAMEMVGN